MEATEKENGCCPTVPLTGNKNQVCDFLGVVRLELCVKCHLVNLSLITFNQPNYTMRWTLAAEKAFKVAITRSLVPQTPDYQVPFLIHTNYSETGLDVVLSQEF